MMENTYKGIKVTIVRALPQINVRVFRRGRAEIVSESMQEILCIICGKPKTIRQRLLRQGKSLAHASCSNKRNREQDRANLTEEEMKTSVVLYYKNSMKGHTDIGKPRRRVELTFEQIEKLIFENCAYCGCKPHMFFRDYPFKYNGIDRINSNIHYTIENCVSCCRECNRAKHTMSVKKFLGWLARIAKFNGYTKTLEEN